ncbi:MAG: type II toxin-antitoxin system prevent-host-death family antitoxin [Candidatus Nealsonbacteria bacterium]
MDFNEIKKIIEEDGGKIIIVENGEPVMVVTSFADYKKGRTKPELKPKGQNPKPVFALPADQADDRQDLPTELSNEELKIEDLPF